METTNTAKLEALKEASRLAIERARSERTPEAREAAVQASAQLSKALVEFGALPKPRAYASRAGKRQAAEREALRLESLSRARR